MEFSTAHGIQLAIALLFGLLAFVGTFTISAKSILAILVVIIPFQFVNSRYGSMNVVLVYLVFIAFLLRSRITALPFSGGVALIFLAYLLSMAGSPRGTWFDHIVYLISVFSNFLLFYITYNVFLRYPDLRFALRLLIVMNILCVVYAMLLYAVGYDRMAFLGIEEWTLNQNNQKLQRMVGAFNAAGVTAAYYASQMLFLLYAAMFTERGWQRYLCYGLVLVNFALIVASGSRGSFLALLGGLGLFFFFMRPALGVVRTTRIAMAGVAGFVALSVYVVSQTDFNVLFERLGETELSKSGVPDTRQLGFDMTVSRVNEAIIIGHGPNIQLVDEYKRRIPGYRPLGFHPHNLALFLLYTVGIVGSLAYIFYFCQLFFWFLRAKRNRHPSTAVRYTPILAMIFMVMFFVDELKIEYLRLNFSDYQHYIFYLLGMLAAFAKVARTQRIGAASKTSN